MPGAHPFEGSHHLRLRVVLGDSQNLYVAGLACQHQPKALLAQSLGRLVHPGDQRAGGVDDGFAGQSLSVVVRDSVGGNQHAGAFRQFFPVFFRLAGKAALDQVLLNPPVVHDFAQNGNILRIL
jgi:hypothetical protein